MNPAISYQMGSTGESPGGKSRRRSSKLGLKSGGEDADLLPMGLTRPVPALRINPRAHNETTLMRRGKTACHFNLISVPFSCPQVHNRDNKSFNN